MILTGSPRTTVYDQEIYHLSGTKKLVYLTFLPVEKFAQFIKYIELLSTKNVY